MSKDYTIEKIEKPEEVIKRTNGSIALNTIFAVAGFALAGVSFGLGLSTLLAFGGVGISSASIRALRENLKIKSAAQEQIQGKTKWLK